MSSLRADVLRVYKRIFVIRRTWTAIDPAETETEKEYIRSEARNLFKLNKNLTDPAEIRLKLQEAEARIDIGHHYQIPYPRPVYVPPTSYIAKTERVFEFIPLIDIPDLQSN